MLRQAGSVNERYLEGILENRAKNGPYFVIVPSFAMPHARPEDGVLETGFSLVTLRTPVVFGHEDHDPVDIILTVAATDRKALNEDVIVQVMHLLDSDGALAGLRAATSVEDVQRVFDNLPKE